MCLLRVVVRSKGILGLGSSVSPQPFLSGSQEPGPGCVTLSGGLSSSGLSLPICTGGMGGTGPHFPGSPSRGPHVPHGPSPIPFGCFGCEASVAAPAHPQHCLAVLLCPSLFLPLPLTTPISASSFLLGSRFLLSPLSLDPRSSQTWFTFRWLQRYFSPSLLPPRPGEPHGAGAPPALPPSPLPPGGAISVKVPWALGLCHLSHLPT